ncbi:MAG: hypothetical protein LAT75_08815 [Candidatus Cyclonatronum sp.]|uniref:baeRF7 domain-containing protein n=1 Tax=Cyclonatronum sp. TaxID=3024185 RepID=UPI0025C13545|nr:hypothetical protein [Cyclonatronum sp.]MCC5932944.1 hypothetical protein [Balneolales bacterium]MCH8486955.1 hypothetical protein [Cyclonatronum sp.]
MKRLSLQYIKELHQISDPVCISLYMPTHRVGNEVRQDQIRFKNLTNQIADKLKERGMRDADIQALLQPFEDFRKESPNWQNLSDGLVMFLSEGHFEVNQFPVSFPELAVVSHRYHLKPLLPLLSGDGLYYLLGISQNKLTLFEGSRFSLKEIDSDFLPPALAEALRIDQFMASQQFHTGGPVTAGGNRAALFHGHGGGGDEDQKPLIRAYFRKVDKELTAFLDDRQVPVVLAGVEFLHPLYHEVNTHPGLLKKGVSGHSDSFSAEELHKRSWSIVQEVFKREEEEARKAFTDMNGSSRVVHKIEEVIPAAAQGKIETLFMAVDDAVWGRFNEGTSEIRVEKEGETSEDLIDLAGLRTLLKGGKVFGVKREQVPGGHQLTGVTRY